MRGGPGRAECIKAIATALRAARNSAIGPKGLYLSRHWMCGWVFRHLRSARGSALAPSTGTSARQGFQLMISRRVIAARGTRTWRVSLHRAERLSHPRKTVESFARILTSSNEGSGSQAERTVATAWSRSGTVLSDSASNLATMPPTRDGGGRRCGRYWLEALFRPLLRRSEPWTLLPACRKRRLVRRSDENRLHDRRRSQ